MNTIPTLADLRASRSVRGALGKAVEMAEACDAAARQTMDCLSDDPAEFSIAMQIATATGAAARAWAAVHAATRPNGAVD